MLFRYLSDLYHATIDKWKSPSISDFSAKESLIQAKKSTTFSANKGNITLYDGDAIVNAANTQLMPGGGVCGAIFTASDYELLDQACQALQGCPTGEAKVTPSFGMNAPWIVHAVGPVWQGGEQNEPALLAGAYRNSLIVAHEAGAKSIAFPAISTGIYGYPLVEATRVAVETIREYVQANPGHFDAIDILCFDDKTLDCYLATMNHGESYRVEVEGPTR